MNTPENKKCSADSDLSEHCSGCTDSRSEGTHQGCTIEHGHVGCNFDLHPQANEALIARATDPALVRKAAEEGAHDQNEMLEKHKAAVATDAWANIEEEFLKEFPISYSNPFPHFTNTPVATHILQFLKKHIEKARLQGKYEELAAHRQYEDEAYEAGYEQGKKDMHDIKTVLHANERGFHAGYQQGQEQGEVKAMAEWSDKGYQAGAEAFKAKAIAAIPEMYDLTYYDDIAEQAGATIRNKILRQVADALNALPLTETQNG